MKKKKRYTERPEIKKNNRNRRNRKREFMKNPGLQVAKSTMVSG